MQQFPIASNPNFHLWLAPMVGLSHVAARELVRSFLPQSCRSVWPTEMLNSKKIPFEKMGETPETRRAADEIGLVPQILGNEEREIQISVLALQKWGAEAIDINMGCSVQKALRHNYGVSLMGDLNYAAQVVQMAVNSSDLPVSVKLRAGLQQDVGYLKDFCQALESAGAMWLVLHPRTADQLRRGHSDWSQIQTVVQALKIPLVGNGDIQNIEDVSRMFEATGCAAVMSGRALLAKPWMVAQHAIQNGCTDVDDRYLPRTTADEGELFGIAVLRMCDFLSLHFPEELALRRLRFYARTTHVWLEFGHRFVQIVNTATSLQNIRVLLAEFFQSCVHRVSAETELRQ